MLLFWRLDNDETISSIGVAVDMKKRKFSWKIKNETNVKSNFSFGINENLTSAYFKKTWQINSTRLYLLRNSFPHI